MLKVKSVYRWPMGSDEQSMRDDKPSLWFTVTGILPGGMVQIKWNDGELDTMGADDDEDLYIPEVSVVGEYEKDY